MESGIIFLRFYLKKNKTLSVRVKEKSYNSPVQIQGPTSRSTTTRAFFFLAKFAEFCYHTIFETKSR